MIKKVKYNIILLCASLSISACVAPVFVKELEPGNYNLHVRGNDMVKLSAIKQALNEKADTLCGEPGYDEVQPMQVENIETKSYVNGRVEDGEGTLYSMLIRCK